jgi:outer membrane protein TolC
MTMFKPSKTLGAIFLLTASAAAPVSAQNNSPAPTKNPNQGQNLLQDQQLKNLESECSRLRSRLPISELSKKPPTKPEDVKIKSTRSITLRQALDLSQQDNDEIRTAKKQTESSCAAIRGAQAAESLRVSANGTLEKNGSPVIANSPNLANFNGASSTPLTASIQATYNIFSGGANGARVEAARGQVRLDQLDVDRIALRVRSDVITAYYDLQEADEQLKINDAAVKNSERSLRDARLQEQAGLGTKFDVIRAEVQKATAEQDVVRISSQQQNARKRLAQIFNSTKDVEYISSEEVTPRGTWTMSLENSISLALNNRPEIKQVKIRSMIRKEQINVARAGDQPRIDLVASYGLRKDFEQSVGFADNYSVGAQVRWDFFDGGAASASAAQTQALNDKDEDEKKVGISNAQVRLQVEQAYNTLIADQKNINTSTGGLKQAEESLRLARLRFAAGVGTQTDVISAETELTRARSNRLRAVIGYNRSLSTLRNAVLPVITDDNKPS